MNYNGNRPPQGVATQRLRAIGLEMRDVSLYICVYIYVYAYIWLEIIFLYFILLYPPIIVLEVIEIKIAVNLVKIYAGNYFLNYLLAAFKSRQTFRGFWCLPRCCRAWHGSSFSEGEDTQYPWGQKEFPSIHMCQTHLRCLCNLTPKILLVVMACGGSTSQKQCIHFSIVF